MRCRSRLRALLCGLGVLAATSACAGRTAPLASASEHPSRSPTPAVTSPAPHATRPPAALSCPRPMGAAVELRDPHTGAAFRLVVEQPSVSRTSLSSSYGYAPLHGFYVTVHVRLTATGDQPVLIGPANFFASVGGAHVTTNDGNAPYSGASRALDSTAADPGETVTGPLTFDVTTPHGVVYYEPNSKPICGWTF